MQWLPTGWRPKVVAVDIDGTLTDGMKQLDTGAVEALRRLEVAGIPVVLKAPRPIRIDVPSALVMGRLTGLVA